ncbi:MAG: manganese catalase family protein [Clostridium sp.]
MFKHEKQLLHEVKVEAPNAAYANLIQEQLGGANGELTAALTYFIQSFRIKNKEIKDLFLDIAAEEFGHAEIVATTVNLLNGEDVDAAPATVGGVEASVVSRLTPMLANASGYLWTAAYVNETGDLAADLLTNIGNEQRAKTTYENLYRQIKDKHVRETIQYLLQREEAHNTMFREAFNKIIGTGSLKDWGDTEDAKYYLNLSTPGQYFGDLKDPKAPEFENPDPGKCTDNCGCKDK